ncbi:MULTISPECIES: sacsin N-terminal ATP-binding-like domain-containing protein [Olivibacter]|uniref:Sacsin N-terminal ATP-binding-like domain-containing protein n=1 Tax=Olivibacter jilunii TaxID=985016 RepID=A0ABW6AYY6_9SPHI
MPICKLCQEREANKKNTHYLTDAIIRTCLNLGGANDREKGLYFALDNSNPFIDFNFQRLDELTLESTIGRKPTEDEIENAKSIPFSVDYVFCSQCEKLFTDVENPFINDILPHFRKNDLTGHDRLNEADIITIRNFFYIQIYRSAVCENILDFPEEFVEKLRTIILAQGGDSSIPLSIIALSYEDLSELNDMKQHADKIIQGIKKLEENDANRAIWELFQNAIDLSENSEITIALTEDHLVFRHNGEPFTPMTLDCLFKQVSSKTLEERKITFEDNEPVGQYGTGFITSHTFGKQIEINGALIKDEGYVALNNFFIDRDTDNWKELGQRIRLLKKEVARLLKDENTVLPPYPDTEFSFKTVTKNNKDCAIKAVNSLQTILPYVITLNPRLKKVTVKDLSGSTTVYQRKDSFSVDKLHSTSILINQDCVDVFYLKSEDNKITVILPFSSSLVANDLSNELPKLFLFYPLVGTQDFGINYILHSRHFLPNEPRNGLYLKSNNEDNQNEEEANRNLIDTASQLIFEYVGSNAKAISNPIKLARINFKTESEKPLLNEYFRTLKASWIEHFKSFPLVETKTGNIVVSKSVFIDTTLLRDSDVFDAIFTLVDFFWDNTPLKHLTKEWSAIIDEWNLNEIKYVGYRDLALKIKEVGNLANIPHIKELKTLYQHLIKEGHGDLFNSFELLPNIKGEFRLLSGLNNNISLPQELIEIADIIMPDIPKRHINSDFKFDLDLNPYTRKNYTTDINVAIGEKIKDKTLAAEIVSDFLEALISYSKISPSIESNSVPTRLIKLICDYYSFDSSTIEIPAVKDDELDNRVAQRRLIRLFLNDLSKANSEWVGENLQFLEDVLEIGPSYYDYEEMFSTLAVFPNQLNELTSQNFLKVDDNIPESIKDIYDQIVKPNFPIRANLIHKEFTKYLKIQDKKTVRNLTEKIETVFFETSQFTSIENHPLKEYIIDIIQKFKIEAEYEKYFPVVFSKRSSILVELADGDDSNLTFFKFS